MIVFPLASDVEELIQHYVAVVNFWDIMLVILFVHLDKLISVLHRLFEVVEVRDGDATLF